MYEEVPVAAVHDETAEMRLLRLDLSESRLGESYTTPGQYVKVRAGGGESYFAIASAPPQVELLVKRGGAAADALFRVRPGDRVSLSAAGGKGFPMAEARGHSLLLVAAGSGVAPMRAVIQAVVARRRDYGDVVLFHGQRSQKDFAFTSEHGPWKHAGVRVVQVVSRDDDGAPRLAGYVQHALLEHRPDTADARAFLAGMKQMIAPVTEALISLGMPRAHIHLNY